MAGDPVWKQPRPLRDPKRLKRKRWGIKTSARTRRRNEAKYLHAQEQRDIAYARDGWRCVRCGTGRGLHAHHIRQRSLGGKDDADNLATLCHECHGWVHEHIAEATGKGWLR